MGVTKGEDTRDIDVTKEVQKIDEKDEGQEFGNGRRFL